MLRSLVGSEMCIRDRDPLNFPIRLNNKLAYLNSIANRGDFPPTQSTLKAVSYTHLTLPTIYPV